MTQIDFYTHVDNKLQTLCTLAAKALAKNASPAGNPAKAPSQ